MTLKTTTNERVMKTHKLLDETPRKGQHGEIKREIPVIGHPLLDAYSIRKHLVNYMISAHFRSFSAVAHHTRLRVNDGGMLSSCGV